MSGSIRIRTVIWRAFGVYGRRAFGLSAASVCVVASIIVLNLASVAVALPSRLAVAVGELAVLSLFTGYVVQTAVEVFECEHRRAPDLLLQRVMPVFGELMLVGLVAGFVVGALWSIASTIAAVVAITALLNIGASLIGLIGFATIGTIVFFAPGLILVTIWSVIAPVVVLERPGRLRALRRSRELVQGNRLRVAGMVVIFIVVLTAAARAVVFAGARVGSGGGVAAALIGAVLFAPIPVLCATALYYELRGDEARVSCTQPPPPSDGHRVVDTPLT